MSRVLVTGATAGIGKAVVEDLCSSGHRVFAVARRQDKLDDLAAATGCTACAGDVVDAMRMAQIVEQSEPDILINNAGIGLGLSGLANLSEADIARAISTNVTAPLQLSRMVLPAMKAAGAGHIINIGSIAGLHTLVSAVYGAGKAAIHRFSQNLRHELVGSGIRVTEICPGRVESEFYDTDSGNIENHGVGVPDFTPLQPADIARAVSFAISAPPHVNISTIEILPTGQAVGGVKTQGSSSS